MKPTLSELAATYVRGLAADLADGDPVRPIHLATRWLPEPDLPTPVVGQIWRVEPHDVGLAALVALTWNEDDTLRGVLVSDQTWCASSDDIVLPAASSPTGEDLLLCTWNDTLLSHAALKGFIGTIPREILEALQMLLQRRLTGGFALRARDYHEADDGRLLLRWDINPLDAPANRRSFETGPRILEEHDPRLEVQAALRDCTAWLERQAWADFEAIEERSLLLSKIRTEYGPQTPEQRGLLQLYHQTVESFPITPIYIPTQENVSIVGSQLGRIAKGSAMGALPGLVGAVLSGIGGAGLVGAGAAMFSVVPVVGTLAGGAAGAALAIALGAGAGATVAAATGTKRRKGDTAGDSILAVPSDQTLPHDVLPHLLETRAWSLTVSLGSIEAIMAFEVADEVFKVQLLARDNRRQPVNDARAWVSLHADPTRHRRLSRRQLQTNKDGLATASIPLNEVLTAEALDLALAYKDHTYPPQS